MSPVSTIIFSIYVRALGMYVAHCKHCCKYLMVEKDGVIADKCQSGFLYTDVVCLIARNEQDMQRILIVYVDVSASML